LIFLHPKIHHFNYRQVEEKSVETLEISPALYRFLGMRTLPISRF